MKKSFKKFKKGPFITAILFLAAATSAFVFLYKQINSNIQISMTHEAELQAETSKKDEAKSFEKLLNVIREERILLDTHFVKSSDVVVFLDTVENMASLVNAEAKVTLVDVTPDNTSLSVGMTASGTFEELYKFLTLLENAPYQLEFTSMSIQRVGSVEETVGVGEENTNTGVQWSAVFKIKVFSFLQ